MSGNTFGKLFKITTWGESHGKGVGVVIDGCPPHIPLDESVIQAMLDRRRPGGSAASTSRKEPDRAMIMSGVFEGMTTGTPIMIMVKNKDADSSAYKPYADLYRPGHGDITYQAKYNIRDWRGGGRSSARETVARVAAGAVAKAILEKETKIQVTAYTIELGGIRAKKRELAVIDQNPYYCPDLEAALEIENRIKTVREKGDSLGGIVEIAAKGVPAGLGDPVFDKLDADFARALMSIGAVKGVEIGAGFKASRLTGSENNDPITPEGFETNNSGGILAGISNGDDIIIRVAVKPIPSITMDQKTVDFANNPATISTRGRHDISAIPRINVVCESMVYLVLADRFLGQKALSC